MRYIKVEHSIVSNPRREIAEVAHWLLEINEHGKPVLEIAISTTGLPVPPGEKDVRGIWCDSSCLFCGPEWEDVSVLDFQANWSAVHGND